MSNPSLQAGCLSFFTQNHSSHGTQWLQKGNELTLVCFACLVEIIENKNEPSIRRTKTLHELLRLVANGTILRILTENEAVLNHLMNCLWLLIDIREHSEAEVRTVIEIIYQLCCGIKSDTLAGKVIEVIAVKLGSSENFKHAFPYLDLLGKLLKKLPELSGTLVRDKINLVAALQKWIAYPDENIRSSLFFILTHLYRLPECSTRVPEEITESIFRECCEILTSATSRELQINSCALLQSLTGKEITTQMSKIINASLGKIITSLKKAFLSRCELVQTIAIHCLNNLVLFDENIVTSDLSAFLFEVFTSNSDTLLSLGWQYVSSLLDRKDFYAKGHVTYGFDAMLSALMNATESKHFKMSTQGFEVLGKVLANCPNELSLISSQDVREKFLEALNKGISSSQNNVFLQAASCLSLAMERRHYGYDVPYGNLMKLLEIVVQRLGRTCSDSRQRSTAENEEFLPSIIVAVLSSINKSLDLVMMGRSEPTSIESLLASTEKTTQKEIHDFAYIILKSCDQVCIPVVISNLQNLRSTAALEIFFSTLNKLLQSSSQQSREMAEKFAASCFIRIALETKAHHVGKASFKNLEHSINTFLQAICLRLFPAPIQARADIQMNDILRGINGTVQELLQVLKQKNSGDETLKSIQECIVVLFYLAYKNNDRLAPKPQLLHALSMFLVHNPTCFDNSIVSIYSMSYLMITELYGGKKVEDMSPLLVNAQRVLADGLMKHINDLGFLYFHDFAFLRWSLEFEGVDLELRREITELWFNHEHERGMDERKITFWKEMVDEKPEILVMLVSVLTKVEPHLQDLLHNVLYHLLHHVELEAVKPVLLEIKQNLQKKFLSQAVQPIPEENMEGILKFLSLLVTSCPSEPHDDELVKLVYHVVSFLTNNARSPGLRTTCLNFLNACIFQDTKRGSEKILSFLLNHKDYNEFLEQMIQAFTEQQRPEQSSVLETTLVSIAHLLSFQSSFGLSTNNFISVKIEAVLPLLCQSSRPLLQFAANIFWESVLASMQSSPLFKVNIIFQSGNTTSEQKLSQAHLRMILVFVQNSLLHPNPLVKLSALKCLRRLLTLEDVDEDLGRNPWNNILLRECQDFTDPTSVTFFLKLLTIVLQNNSTSASPVANHLIKEATHEILAKPITFIKPTENQVSRIYGSSLMEFIKTVTQHNPEALTTIEISILKCKLEEMVNTYLCHKGERHTGRSFIYVKDLLIHCEMIDGKLNDPQQSLNELLSLINSSKD